MPHLDLSSSSPSGAAAVSPDARTSDLGNGSPQLQTTAVDVPLSETGNAAPTSDVSNAAMRNAEEGEGIQAPQDRNANMQTGDTGLREVTSQRSAPGDGTNPLVLHPGEASSGESGEGGDQPVEKSLDEIGRRGDEGIEVSDDTSDESTRVGPGGGLGALADGMVGVPGVSAEGCNGGVVEVGGDQPLGRDRLGGGQGSSDGAGAPSQGFRLALAKLMPRIQRVLDAL
jgi:hypothetical protein